MTIFYSSDKIYLLNLFSMPSNIINIIEKLI
jgi:hypothetical protein